MSGECKVTLVFVVCLTLMIGGAIYATWHYNFYTTKALIEGGYEQRLLPGHSTPLWVKSTAATPEKP